MTQKQMIELVRQHHPEAGETEIRRWLNQAMREFCRKTRILKSAYTFTTVANQRWYGFDESILEVLRVDYDGYSIKRLIGNPNLRDLT
jgi:hypothetical protein